MFAFKRHISEISGTVFAPVDVLSSISSKSTTQVLSLCDLAEIACKAEAQIVGTLNPGVITTSQVPDKGEVIIEVNSEPEPVPTEEDLPEDTLSGAEANDDLEDEVIEDETASDDDAEAVSEAEICDAEANSEESSEFYEALDDLEVADGDTHEEIEGSSGDDELNTDEYVTISSEDASDFEEADNVISQEYSFTFNDQTYTVENSNNEYSVQSSNGDDLSILDLFQILVEAANANITDQTEEVLVADEDFDESLEGGSQDDDLSDNKSDEEITLEDSLQSLDTLISEFKDTQTNDEQDNQVDIQSDDDQNEEDGEVSGLENVSGYDLSWTNSDEEDGNIDWTEDSSSSDVIEVDIDPIPVIDSCDASDHPVWEDVTA